MTNGEYRTLKDLPQNERPRERLILHGEDALSNAELLAIALRVGGPGENAVALGQRLLATFDGLGGLARVSIADLCRVPGIGPSKAAQVKAALVLGRRLILAADAGHPQIRSPQDAANVLLAAIGDSQQEQLRVLLLDNRHRVLRTSLLYVGSVHTAVVRVAEVFREAVRDNVAAIIVGHNHPSGDPEPSTEDVQITGSVVKAGRLLDIEVLDHLIVGRQGYVSLKERGLGFD